MADKKKGLLDQIRDRLSAQINEYLDDAPEELAAREEELLVDNTESMAKATGLQPGSYVPDERDEAANRPREKYRYRRASLVDPSLSPALGEAGYGVYRPRYSHITNKTLKEMSLRDPIVAAIMQTRINQVSRFSKPQASRFEPGFKIVPNDPTTEVGQGTQEEEEVKFLEDYICNTGSNIDRDPDSKMDFDTFLKLVIRDRLTFGAAAVETIRDNLGRIHSFVPAPTESIYYANKQLSADVVDQVVQANQMAYKQALAYQQEEKMETADNERERNRAEDEDYEFVQVLNGRVHQGFTKKEMLYKLGNPQNFITNNGYAIGELEFATLAVTAHLQAENYNKLFFTHGFASRGLLHIQGDVTPSTLKSFRSQWYAQVSGNANSWRTPIIAGVDDVKWVDLAASNRDMEYSNYVDHIIRTLCALFAISPIEIGFDYLTKGQGTGGLGQEDNETKLQQSQVRGLKPLLVWIETIINEDIIPNVDEKLAEKYSFEFVGLEAESKMEELERQLQESQVRATLNEIREESGLDPVLAGEIISNPTWIQVLFQTHTIGQIREHLFGYRGDSDNPKYDYIESPSWFQQRNLVDPEIKAQQQMQAMMAFGQEPGAEGEEGEEVPPEEEGAEEEQMSPEEMLNMPGMQPGGPPMQTEEELYAQDGDYAGADPAMAGVPEEEEEEQKKSRKVKMDLVKAKMKSASKSYQGYKLDNRLEKVRQQYLKDYKDTQKKMMEEIFDTIKEDLVEEE
jgi:uncharacterized protein YnzC (UPF0291/DUF896 family)